MQIVEEGFGKQDSAAKAEITWIETFLKKGAVLANRMLASAGVWVASEETRIKLSQSQRKRVTPESRARQSQIMKTRLANPLARIKISKAIKKWWAQPGVNQAQRNALKDGWTPEARSRQSQIAIARMTISKNREHCSTMAKKQWAKPGFRKRFSFQHHIAMSRPEVRAKLSLVAIGKKHGPHSEQTKKKIGDAQRGVKNHAFGKQLSEEHKAKISAGNRGRIYSAESRAKISASKMGHVVSEETRAKLRAANLGKRASPETKVKLSLANKRRKEK